MPNRYTPKLEGWVYNELISFIACQYLMFYSMSKSFFLEAHKWFQELNDNH